MREERRDGAPGGAAVAASNRHELPSWQARVRDRDLQQLAGLELAGHRGLRQERDAEALLHHLLCRVDVVELHDALGSDSRSPEERVRQLGVARGPVEEHELLARDLFQPDPPALGEAMARIGDEHEAVFVQRRTLDVRMAEGPDEPELDLLADDELEDLLGVARPDADAHAGVADREPLQDRGKDVRRERRGRAEREPTCAPSLERVHEAPAVRQRVERTDGVGKVRLARLGEAHPARRADEERRSELGLEPLDPRRQRGLRHEEGFGGPAHTSRPRDLDERLHLREQHINKAYRTHRNERFCR